MAKAKNPVDSDWYEQVGTVMVQWIKDNAKDLKNKSMDLEKRIVPAIAKMDQKTKNEYIKVVSKDLSIWDFYGSLPKLTFSLGTVQQHSFFPFWRKEQKIFTEFQIVDSLIERISLWRLPRYK